MKDRYGNLIKKALAPLIHFWFWWLDELADARQVLMAGRKRREADILHFRTDGDMLHISTRLGQVWQEQKQVSLADENISSAAIRDFLTSVTPRGRWRTILHLPREYCLAKPLILPRAALGDIRDILLNQIDRLTPYSARQVYFDYQLNVAEYTAEKIKLDIFIVPKIKCDALLALLQRNGVAVDCLEIKDVSGRPSGEVNLHRRHAVHRREMRWPVRGRVMAVAVCCLAALPMVYNNYQISVLEKNIGDSSTQARSSAQLKQEYENLKKDVHYLVDKKYNRPLVIQVVSEISVLLGDDTWLEQLTVRKGNIQIFGYSGTASGVLEDIETSPLFKNARFLSAVVKQKDKNVERFQVAADVNMPSRNSTGIVRGRDGK